MSSLVSGGLALVSGEICCSGTRAESVEGVQGSTPASVMLADGSVVSARRGVVVAVEGPEAKRLLGPALEVGGQGST